MEPITTENWLQNLQSNDVEMRNRAAHNPAAQSADVLTKVADLMAHADKGVARAATQALQHIALNATHPKTPKRETERVAQTLLQIASDATRPRMVRSEALHALGFVGDSKIVAPLSRLLSDETVREDARMALERIPGPQSLRALEQALQTAPADFQPALRQSLFNRNLSPANAGAIVLR